MFRRLLGHHQVYMCTQKLNFFLFNMDQYNPSYFTMIITAS
jgi:hypothetical protein